MRLLVGVEALQYELGAVHLLRLLGSDAYPDPAKVLAEMLDQGFDAIVAGSAAAAA